MGYAEKLKDPRWQRRRLEVMQRDGWACVRCGSTDKTLNVHHLSYDGEPWEGPLEKLITLCEDCHGGEHNEDHERSIRIYAAGKISKGDWRCGLGEVPFYGDHDHEPRYREKVICVVDRVQYIYVGPWFVACDHGCFHGSESHGVGAVGAGCEGLAPDHTYGERRDAVVNVSFAGIDSADVVYVLLDHADQYGTLVELGYAIGKRKPIIVDVVTDSRLRGDLWFAERAAYMNPEHEYRDQVREVLGVSPVLEAARARAVETALLEGHAPEEVADAATD